MNIKILIVLLLSVVLAGCMAQGSGGGTGPLANCATHSNGLVCKGDPQAPTININTQSAKLKAKPACVKAVEGTLLIFRLTPAGNQAKGTVEIVPKDDNDPNDDWLAGTNSDYADLIMIPVPADLADGDYKYGIKAGSKCVDPRVHVQ